MSEPAELKVIKLVRELSETKKKLSSAERKASIYRTLLAKEKRKTTDAKPAEQRQTLSADKWSLL